MNNNNQHITKLINRCKKGDSKAQLQVYQLYYKAMFNTAFRIVNDSFEAEDIMQEAFLSAFTKLSSFKAEVTFGAWLKRIVINKSLTQLKKISKIEQVSIDNVGEVGETKEIELDYTNVNVQVILESIQSLKDNYRIVLTLHLIEGYDNEEIAQILEYTNENVRTTISRAKKKLKQILVTEKTFSSF